MKILTERFCKETLFHPFRSNEASFSSRVAAVASWVFTFGIFPLVVAAINGRIKVIQRQNAVRLHVAVDRMANQSLSEQWNKFHTYGIYAKDPWGEYVFARLFPTATVLGIGRPFLDFASLPIYGSCLKPGEAMDFSSPVVRFLYKEFESGYPNELGMAARVINDKGEKGIIRWRAVFGSDRASCIRSLHCQMSGFTKEIRDEEVNDNAPFFKNCQRLFAGESADFGGQKWTLFPSASNSSHRA